MSAVVHVRPDGTEGLRIVETPSGLPIWKIADSGLPLPDPIAMQYHVLYGAPLPKELEDLRNAKRNFVG